jgi:hypothetical protein
MSRYRTRLTHKFELDDEGQPATLMIEADAESVEHFISVLRLRYPDYETYEADLVG